MWGLVRAEAHLSCHAIYTMDKSPVWCRAKQIMLIRIKITHVSYHNHSLPVFILFANLSSSLRYFHIKGMDLYMMTDS